MSEIKKVGLLGGGVIGAGWAARCVLNGLDAIVCDLDPEAERKLGEVVANAERAMRNMTLAPLGPRGRLRVTREIEDAAAEADFIQESLPENEDVKIPLLKRAAKAARDNRVTLDQTSAGNLMDIGIDVDDEHPVPDLGADDSI